MDNKKSAFLTALFLFLCMVPMMCFAACSVVLIVKGHPYAAIPFVVLSCITIPKFGIGKSDGK